MTTDIEMNDPQPGAHHNHAADVATVASTKCITSMKRKAASTEDKPQQIYAAAVETLTADEKAYLPCEDTIKRTLRN